MRSCVLAAAAGTVLVAGLSACSPTDPAGADAQVNPAGAAGGAPAPADPQVLRLAQLDDVGRKVVVNGKGRTIYRFENDSSNPPKTTCVDDCRKTWQPVLAPNGVQIGIGIEEELVGTVTRPEDGAKQLTLNGWPLYYFHGDTRLGQTAGHGVAGKWFAITATGGKARNA